MLLPSKHEINKERDERNCQRQVPDRSRALSQGRGPIPLLMDCDGGLGFLRGQSGRGALESVRLLLQLVHFFPDPFGVLGQLMHEGHGPVVEEEAGPVQNGAQNQQGDHRTQAARYSDPLQPIDDRGKHKREQHRGQQYDQNRLGDVTERQHHGDRHDDLRRGLDAVRAPSIRRQA